MKKLILTLSLITFSLSLVYSQTYYTRAAGAWNDNINVWSTVSQTGAACSCNPGTNIAGSNAVYIYNNISSFGALSSLSGSGKIVIESGDSAIITTSNLNMSGSSGITVNSGAVLIINGALNMSGSTGISNNGIMVVYGNISNSGSATVTNNGDLTVHGNVTTTGSAAFSGTGTSYVIGKLSGAGTSSLSVLPSFFTSFSGASGNGLVEFQTSPILSFQPLQFNGNASTVLTGNGTFTNVSTFSPWVQSGSNLYYTAGNVGIGTSGPLLYPLVVQGTALVNGNLFANNVAAANGMSVGTFRIVNGVVDSFVSSATTLQLQANNVNASNNLSATTVTGTTLNAGTTGPSVIKIDGNAGTITSPSGNVGFGNNSITTTGAINAGTLNTGYFMSDSMQVSHIKLHDSLLIIGDPLVLKLPPPTCFCPMLTTWPNGFFEFGSPGNPCNVAFGIGTFSSITGLAISSCGRTNQLSIFNPNTSVNVFNVDENGNTQVAGNMAVGTNIPSAQLTVGNNSLTLDNDQGGAIELGGTSNANPVVNGTPYIDFHYGNGLTQDYNFRIINSHDGQMDFQNTNGIVMTLINNANTNYVRATEVRVCMGTCDFVFEKDYKLMPLEELEKYLQLNHHLPGIASAKEMEASDGVSVGKMNSQLLQKVEELTLYTIELKKQMDEMKAEITELKKNK